MASDYNSVCLKCQGDRCRRDQKALCSTAIQCVTSIIHTFFCYFFPFYLTTLSTVQVYMALCWIMKCRRWYRKRPWAIWENIVSFGWGNCQRPRVCSRITYFGTETGAHRIQNMINNCSTGSFDVFYWQKVCGGSVRSRRRFAPRKADGYFSPPATDM